MQKILAASIWFLLCSVLPAMAAGPTILVTIPPQKYFVDQITQGQIPVTIMVQPGANPHVYEPKPRQMQDLAHADLYFALGHSFDAVWMERFQNINPQLTIVHTQKGITKIPMDQLTIKSQNNNTHRAAHAEEHHFLDPHIWLDPALVKIQAQHICQALVQEDPGQAQEYKKNLIRFEQELDALDQELRTILASVPQEQRKFLVFHPSWGYFARAYGWQQLAIEVQGQEPGPQDLAQIITQAQDLGLKIIFVQPQFADKTAEVIAREIGATLVYLDPLAKNWAQSLRDTAQALVQAGTSQ